MRGGRRGRIQLQYLNHPPGSDRPPGCLAGALLLATLTAASGLEAQSPGRRIDALVRAYANRAASTARSSWPTTAG